MNRFVPPIFLLPLTAALVGCSHRSDTVIGGPDAQEAAIRMEESEQEYNDCLATRHAGNANCDSLEALYKRDKAEYEAQVQ